MEKIISFLSHFPVGIYVKSRLLKEVKGKENFPKGNFILASNHLSHLDWLIDGWILTPRSFTFIAQVDKMTGVKKFFRDMLYSYADVIRVNRSDKDSKKAALAKAIEMVKKGYCLIIYPEGTRSRDGQTHDFKPGIGKIYVEAGVAVVPSAFKGTFDMMPPGGKMKGEKMISLIIGRPMDFLEERNAASKLDKNSDEYRRICSTISQKIERAVRDLLMSGAG